LTVLGPAYKVAETEFVLCLAKMILQEVTKQRPGLLVSNTVVKEMIKVGDQLWEVCAVTNDSAVDLERKLLAKWKEYLQYMFILLYQLMMKQFCPMTPVCKI
jgi:hypothetical protein